MCNRSTWETIIKTNQVYSAKKEQRIKDEAKDTRRTLPFGRYI
jgi:hypothetical protein